MPESSLEPSQAPSPPSSPRQPGRSSAADVATSFGENQRRIQLLLALADDPGWVSRTWIFKNVPGYTHVSVQSRDRYLRGDTAALLAAGVPLEIVAPESDAEPPKRLRINRQRWFQTDPRFSDAEASVVFRAANAKFGSAELKAAAESAWRKLAAFDRRGSIANPEESVVLADPADLGSGDFSTLLAAMTAPRKTVELWYSPQYGQDDQLRILEPWAMINLRGRFYVMGYDLQREAPRIFRLSRVRDVAVVNGSVTQPMPREDLQHFAEELLHRGEQAYEAVVRIAPGTCADIVRTATPLGDCRYRLPAATLREIVSTGLSYTPDLIVEFPGSARSEIVALLEQVVARHVSFDSGAVSDSDLALTEVVSKPRQEEQ